MISKKSLVVFFFVALVCASCDNNRIYETYHEFEDRTWKAVEIPEFEFRIDDPGKKYNVAYNIRNTLDFPFSRIFITYTLLDSAGTVLQSNLDKQHLFDEKTGTPLGSSGLGDIYDHRFLLIEGYEFKMSGKYKVKLEQFTRQDTLAGVLAVGVRLETAAAKTNR